MGILQEIAERVMGPRRAELLEPEVKLLGDLLYYGLTVWAGESKACTCKS